MKKFVSFNLIFVLLALCGCADAAENTDTQFLMDTFVTLTADCDEETLARAFELCADCERLFSRTVEDSDIARLNRGEDFRPDKQTRDLMTRALWYAEKSGGLFDITVCPVSELWNYKNQVVPTRDEIARALQNVDYHRVTVTEDGVRLDGCTVDLGGIAKGYIADQTARFLKENGAKRGIVNLGGNLVIFGRTYTVGIQKPFAENGEIAAKLSLKDKSVVTSGIYERCFEQDGTLYHHIIDPRTGYPVQTDLAGATVIGDVSADCDALSTVCILFGYDRANELIESTPDTEAVFVLKDGTLKTTSGLKKENGKYVLK